MKPTLFLRIASVLALVQAVLHTIGGVFGKPDPGPGTVAVLAMKANHFDVAGFDRTYWDFFFAFGLAISVFLAVEGVVFWCLGSLARNDPARLRPILAAFFVGYVALAVLAYLFIFPPPVINDILIAFLLGLAFMTARKTAIS